MERQANRFAAELLMPEAVCRAMRAYTVSSRFLEHQLARDLLVSREAMRWRLRELGEPRALASGGSTPTRRP
jgi:Zn-dependent peptidase ImmA (M78 family)